MNRRKYRRIARPFAGTWRGGAGDGTCRIADLSAGGCYVQSLAMPARGEATVITVYIGDETVTLNGRVVYAEQGMGFAVEFIDVSDEERQRLNDLLAPFLGDSPSS